MRGTAAILRDEGIEKRIEIAAMRKAGASTAEIAVALGISEVSVNRHTRIIRQEWIDRANEDYQVMVAEANARYEEAHQSIWPLVLCGDQVSFANWLKLEERRAKLLGLDHSDKVAEARLAIEAAKLDMLASALAKALDDAGVNPEIRASIAEALDARLAELETA